MGELMLSPPAAFLAYLALAAVLAGLGRLLAGPARPSPLKTSTYASGEPPAQELAVPGYRRFFGIALFFAVLHLGVLMIGTSGFSPFTGVYIGGLILALIALILG